MNHEMIRDAHQQMRAAKEHWWHHHQEPDPPPALFVRWRDVEPVAIDCGMVGAMIRRVHDLYPTQLEKAWGIPADQPPGGPALLYVTLGALNDGVPLPGCEHPPGKGAPIEGIMFNVEGWAREILTPEAETLDEAIEQAGDQMPERGDLEHDYRTNPNSDVRESMTTYMVETGPLGSAEWMRCVSLFHKDDGGIIVWHDPVIDDSENPHEGQDALIEVMCHFVTRETLS